MIWVTVASVLGGTLVLAGLPKLRDRAGLLTAVQGYALLPAPVEAAVARLLPIAEIVVGGALILGIARTWAALAAAALFLAFFAGLTINLVRGRRDLDCGCFAFGGSDDVPRIGWFHAARAGALALTSVALAVTAGAGAGVLEHLAGVAAAALFLSASAAFAQLRAVVSLGRRPVDDHLSPASTSLRALEPLR
ncbi:DoxX family membrane protein [Rhodococcus triatomae]|uniref:Methylamine utilisation protein MauE n=1 Tax=Rhodococcus triatomae TaxID=300028 RepID=A0A1G8A6Q3_9NOCA|nr:MauE/DoxX family redox-associated membrane protein [Rhodococcus triatomae]QNG17845.1 DoxX family membrane protein [Rhodococcus triatomae]QNG22487.1 DoxX family membrane protein [Rhodococcus triatomae]SDH16536.1 Methylamine utilisation protein MauE [Rhodococcus triatomae]